MAQISNAVIYNESKCVEFYREDDTRVPPICYGGSIYLPAQTAGEWLGKEAAWDPEALTVNLLGDTAPQVKGRGDGNAWGVSSDILREWRANGVDVQLRPDITVMLDGQPQRFVNVNGEAVHPILWDDTVFLPLRSIGELCGKEVFYVPVLPAASVYIRAAMTDAEREALTAYLNQALALTAALEEKVSQLLAASREDTVWALEQLKAIQADLAALQALAQPDAAYFDAAYRDIQSTLAALISDCGSYIAELEGGRTYAEVMSRGMGVAGVGAPDIEPLQRVLEAARQGLGPLFQTEQGKLMMAY